KFKEEDRFFLGNKSIEQEEREMGILHKMMDVALYGSYKVTLEHFQTMIKQNKFSEDALDEHVRHYLKKGPRECIGHLKVIIKMLIDQSRETGQTMGTQVVLLFKAIDCLRMIVQYSDQGVDNIASFLLLQIMARMPKAFTKHMSREKEIFNQNVALKRSIKEQQPTINVRNKLASLYLQQRCYADSLYQYESMLDYFQSKKPMNPADREKICVLHLNIAEMFKAIYNWDAELKNGQIFQNFLFRYNRDAEIHIKSRTPITPIRGPVNKMTITQSYKDIKQLTINHYETALKYFPAEKNRKKRSEILAVVGRSYAEMGKVSEAASRLQDSLLLLGKERNSPEIFKEKEDILNLMKQCVGKMPGPKGEKYKSFVVHESNKLEQDQHEWKEEEKRKDEIRRAAEDGRKKVL
ncbi:MAG: hypothetical protein HQM12_07065, partial [SAR324 cluster bacterium]|nr:hypothetical protein [SAR324 cluster bacterium]